jgi:hypothetical protein
MERDIDIFEYEWWQVFTWYLIQFVVSMVFIGACFIGIHIINDNYALWRLSALGVLGSIGLIFSILGIWTIRFVPKLIMFKQNSINIVFPFRREKVFLYEDISRIIIYRRITKRSQLITGSWSPYRVRLYFLSNTIKVIFNPDRLVNYPALLETFKNKGLGSIIEQKENSTIAA